MAEKFASVCVLSYERPKLLNTMLQSLVTHAQAPFELIIHDDGSHDREVYKVIQDFGSLATVIFNPAGHNQGQGVALNRMFHAAQGDPIIKCDQDLVWQPGWLKETNELLAQRWGPNGTDRIGLLGMCHYFNEPVDMRNTGIGVQGPGWTGHTHILGSAFALPRRVWDELGPFSQHSDAFSEDREMQDAVTERPGWCCALPDRELAANLNMGPGPSTIVYYDDDRQVQVSKIHHGPRIHT